MPEQTRAIPNSTEAAATGRRRRHGWIEDSAASRGMTWIIVIFVTSSILVGGAVLRVAGGVFYGLGDPPGEDPEMAKEASEETSETEQARQRTPLTMLVPAAVLVLVAIGIVLAPHLGTAVEAGALRFQDQTAYNATVLSGAHVARPAGVFPAEATGVSVADVVAGAGSAARRPDRRIPRALLAAAAWAA